MARRHPRRRKCHQQQQVQGAAKDRLLPKHPQQHLQQRREATKQHLLAANQHLLANCQRLQPPRLCSFRQVSSTSLPHNQCSMMITTHILLIHNVQSQKALSNSSRQ
jgi:hypothetical protein